MAKTRGRLLEAAQVGHHQDEDEAEAEVDPVVAQLREGRGDRGGAGRDRHGDGERVVDHQRRPRHQRRPVAQVVLRTPGRSRRRSGRRG